MQSPRNKLSQQEIAQAWAKITIIRWRIKMRNLKVQSSGELYRSFVFNVVSSAQGDLTKIEFAFNYYGKFVDMGVGKGTRIGDRPVSRTSRVLEDRMTGILKCEV